MSGSYGFSLNMELTPTNTDNLYRRVLDFLDEGESAQEEILKSVLIEEEDGLIVFFGDNEDTWRYDYSNEVIELLKGIEDHFGGQFKGDLIFFEYALHGDVVQEYNYDGKGNIKYKIYTEELEEDYYPEED